MVDLQERYVASLMPLQKSISPWKVRRISLFQRFIVLWILIVWILVSQSPPQLRPFSQEEFMRTLEKAGPQLTSRLKGDWIGLYRCRLVGLYLLYIYHWFCINIENTAVFNFDNNQKCSLSSKSVYYDDFWRSCDTEDWSNDAENTDVHHRNKLILQYITIDTSHFKL